MLKNCDGDNYRILPHNERRKLNMLGKGANDLVVKPGIHLDQLRSTAAAAYDSLVITSPGEKQGKQGENTIEE